MLNKNSIHYHKIYLYILEQNNKNISFLIIINPFLTKIYLLLVKRNECLFKDIKLIIY